MPGAAFLSILDTCRTRNNRLAAAALAFQAPTGVAGTCEGTGLQVVQAIHADDVLPIPENPHGSPPRLYGRVDLFYRVIDAGGLLDVFAHGVCRLLHARFEHLEAKRRGSTGRGRASNRLEPEIRWLTS